MAAKALHEIKPDTRIFVRGDRNIMYGRVMEVMGALNAAGFARVALIAELPQAATDESPRRGRQR